MGTNLDDIHAFGPAFAVSILTLLYGVMIKLICYVAQQRIFTLSQQIND
jgi:hypothetical protein